MSDVGFVVAFGGGVISFVSPCVLPVVPSYLSTIAGLDLTDPSAPSRAQLTRVVRDTFLFFCGFGAVLCVLGLVATAVGRIVIRNQVAPRAHLRAGWSSRWRCTYCATVVSQTRACSPMRFHPRPSRLGPFAAPVLGAAFAFGWTPCLGPVLASLFAAASNEHGFGRSAVLLLVYAAGLGFPFLVLGCAFSQLTGVFGFLRRRSGRAITVVSSLLLMAFGVLLIVGHLSWVTSEFEAALRRRSVSAVSSRSDEPGSVARRAVENCADTKMPVGELDERPWGDYLVLADEDDHKVKRIRVTPGKRLSYQRHARRSEHWFIVSGTARVTLDDDRAPQASARRHGRRRGRRRTTGSRTWAMTTSSSSRSSTASTSARTTSSASRTTSAASRLVGDGPRRPSPRPSVVDWCGWTRGQMRPASLRTT